VWRDENYATQRRKKRNNNFNLLVYLFAFHDEPTNTTRTYTKYHTFTFEKKIQVHCPAGVVHYRHVQLNAFLTWLHDYCHGVLCCPMCRGEERKITSMNMIQIKLHNVMTVSWCSLMTKSDKLVDVRCLQLILYHEQRPIVKNEQWLIKESKLCFW
jgi:hypothetical protein